MQNVISNSLTGLQNGGLNKTLGGVYSFCSANHDTTAFLECSAIRTLYKSICQMQKCKEPILNSL